MHGFEEVERGADAHEVARLVVREHRRGDLTGVFALGLAFADREAADGETVEGQLGQAVGADLAEVGVEGALDDREHGLGRITAGLEAADGPAVGDLERFLGRGLVRRRRDALVEHHHDIAADGDLRTDAGLGAEQVDGAVYVTAELGAFFLHIAGMRKGEDLEAAGVRQEGFLPAGELVDTAEALEDLGTRTQEQVIGVRQQDLGTGIEQGIERLRLDRRLGAHRHEQRRLHLVVQGAERRRPGPRTGSRRLEFEIQPAGGHRRPKG